MMWMRRRKEMVLRRFKDGKLEAECICRELLDLKRQRLFMAYSDAVEQLKRAKPTSKNHQKILGYVLKTGNKLRAIKEIIGEIEAVDRTLENMIEIEVNGNVYSRLNWNSDYRRSCKDKVKYSDRSAPQAAIEMAAKLGDEMEPYKCRHCDGWHVGHAITW